MVSVFIVFKISLDWFGKFNKLLRDISEPEAIEAIPLVIPVIGNKYAASLGFLFKLASCISLRVFKSSSCSFSIDSKYAFLSPNSSL